MLRTSLVCLSALFVSAAFVPAMAQSEPSEVHQRTVYIGDVDQGTVEGADVILDRIADASRQVCRDDRTASVARIAGSETTRCQAQSTEAAVQDLDNGLVTARYYGVEPHVIVSENDYSDEIVVKKPA